MGGIIACRPDSPLTVLSGIPNASRLFNMITALSLKRKFFYREFYLSVLNIESPVTGKAGIQKRLRVHFTYIP